MVLHMLGSRNILLVHISGYGSQLRLEFPKSDDGVQEQVTEVRDTEHNQSGQIPQPMLQTGTLCFKHNRT